MTEVIRLFPIESVYDAADRVNGTSTFGITPTQSLTYTRDPLGRYLHSVIVGPVTSTVRGLSTEVQQRLNRQRPDTIGQAARMQGITPAAISLLLVHLKKKKHRTSA